MGKLPDHLREERLLRERPAVAREVAALRTQRAQVVGELTGMARALRFVRFATIGIPFLRRAFGRTRRRPAATSRLIDLLHRFGA